jgi:hypothetical protein
MKNKNVIVSILAVIVVLGGIYYFAKKGGDEVVVETTPTSTSTEVVAKPVTKPVVKQPVAGTIVTTTNYYIGINERKLTNGLFITPLHVTYDGRCPSDVQCIQAGTVDVSTLVQLNNLSQTFILSLNKTVSFGGKQITLTEVTPKKLSTKTLTDGDYKFVITVK